jgi:hypothetical protein
MVASGLAFTTCVNEQLAVAAPTLTEQLTGVEPKANAEPDDGAQLGVALAPQLPLTIGGGYVTLADCVPAGAQTAGGDGQASARCEAIVEVS